MAEPRVCLHRSLPNLTRRSSAILTMTQAASFRRHDRARTSSPLQCSSEHADHCNSKSSGCSRREQLAGAAASLTLSTLAWLHCPGVTAAAKDRYETMSSLKGKDYGKVRQRYPDYVLTDSGLQYQDIREGKGDRPQNGSEVVIDWDGYTIGYYGRPFEARNKAKGGSFAGSDQEYFRFKLGDRKVIPAFEEAVASMRPGGIRRIICPVELGYPDNDFNKMGPKPSTFSGKRALDFVLKNQGLIDKTLLFDIELVRVLS